jgi:hypothetical protein
MDRVNCFRTVVKLTYEESETQQRSSVKGEGAPAESWMGYVSSRTEPVTLFIYDRCIFIDSETESWSTHRLKKLLAKFAQLSVIILPQHLTSAEQCRVAWPNSLAYYYTPIGLTPSPVRRRLSMAESCLCRITPEGYNETHGLHNFCSEQICHCI